MTLSIPSTFWDSSLFTWIILPFLIFAARVLDVSLGTIRIIFISKGRRIIAPLLGFIEVLIWLMAIRQIIHNVKNVACYVAFAGGFAMGNYVGMLIEEKLAMGMEVFRVIIKQGGEELFHSFQKAGYGVTRIEAQGATGKVNVIFAIIKRSEHIKVIEMIHKFNPKAFYSVEDVRAVSEGIFPPGRRRGAHILSHEK